MAMDEHVESNSKQENVEKSSRKLEKTVLDNFSHLISISEKVRIKSGINLLRHLTENENEENGHELKYALGRIIRGLGSSTVSARTGFYTTLVALINLRDINVEVIFEHLDKQLHKAGSNTKGENADVCVGQILACGAVMRSNLWDKISEENQKKTLELLLKASKERSYLDLVAYMFITDKIEQLTEKEFQKYFPLIENEISKPWTEQNIDTLYLLISIKIRYPNFIKKKFLKQTLGTEDVICPDSIEPLCCVLMTIPKLTALKHPVYEIISKELAKSKHLLTFLKELDENIERPNRNKQLIVTRIFSTMLQNIDDMSSVPNLLIKNFIQHTLNYYKTFVGKNKDVEYQECMRKFFETLLQTLRPDSVQSDIKIAVLRKLLFYPGTFIFEKITRSKVVQHITSSLSNDGVKELAIVYRGVIEGTEIIDSEYSGNHTWLNNDRLYAAHLLIKLLNHPSVKDENDWKAEQLTFLMDLGLLKLERRFNIGCELAASLKTAFFGALDLNLPKLEDLQIILLQLIKHLDSMLSLDKLETVLRNPITTEDYEVWQKTLEIITKIEKKKKKGHGKLKSVFLTLFLHMGLQLFSDAKLASGSLKELFICYEKTRKSQKNSDNISEDEINIIVEENNDEPLWIEVVMDLLLNLLSQNYHLLRSLVKCIFGHLCQYMTPTTIHQMLSVIDPKNEENPLSKPGEESSDDEMDNEEEVAAEECETDTEDDEELSDEDKIEDDSANDKLRMALHKVLSNDGYQTDEESIDIDQLSTAEGENLNKALAEVFLQFKPNLGKSKKQRKDQQFLMHFRIRVLDLVEIYLASTPSMILTLEIMLPLLQAVEFSIRDEHQKPLHDRLKSCLKKLSTLKQFNDVGGIDETVLNDLLKSLLEKGTKNSMIIQDMGVQIADCCVFVIRCSDMLISSEETPKKVRKRLKNSISEIISAELNSYFHKRDCLTPYILFKNIMKLNWNGLLDLIPLLMGYVFSEEVKPFRKNQALELLKLFYTNQRYLNNSLEKISETLLDEHLKFSQNVIVLFRKLCENPAQKIIKEKFICNLFQLLSSMKSSHLNFEQVSWSDIAENIREYRSYVSFSKDAKVAFNKLCTHLNVSHVVEMRPKIVKSNDLTEDDKGSMNLGKTVRNEKKKKFKNKEQLKLKKEAKQLRLQSLSEGFTNVDFATTGDLRLHENESESDTSNNLRNVEVKKKKRGKLEKDKLNNNLSSKRRKYNENEKEEENGNDVLSESGKHVDKRKRKNSESAALQENVEEKIENISLKDIVKSEMHLNGERNTAKRKKSVH